MGPAYALVALLVAGAMTSASASLSTSCVNITISNILNIGSCVGNTTNVCGGIGSISSTQGIITVTNCVIKGMYQNGSPEGIVSALAPLLLIIVNRLSLTGIDAGALGSYQLCNSSGCLSFLIKNDSCLGSINIGLPATGSLGSCAGDTTTMCTAGSPTTTNMVQSTVQAIACILNQIPMTQLLTVVQGTACQLITAINQATQGNAALSTTFGPVSLALSTQVPNVQCLPTIG